MFSCHANETGMQYFIYDWLKYFTFQLRPFTAGFKAAIPELIW